MYGKRRHKRARRARKRIPRKTWLDKRGRSQRLLERGELPAKCVFPRGRC